MSCRTSRGANMHGHTEMHAYCPQCRRGAGLLCQTMDHNRQVARTVFHYYRCPECGYIFIGDPPADLAPYYPEDYYSLPGSVHALAAGAVLETYKIEMVQRFVRGGRLIEIGPGRGNFCYLAQEAGFEVAAIERSAACCAFLGGAPGVSVIHAQDEYAALERAAPADVIAMWHVIEHLRDPWRFLELAAARLNDRGILVVATPNPESFQFRLFGNRWTHLDAPRHLNLIPRQLLARRMADAGLRPVLVTTADPGSLGWNQFGWAFSCANFFSGKTVRRGARLAGRWVARAMAGFERVEGRGAAYTGVFQKVLP